MNPVQRVIVYRIGSLGDTLVALPAFHLVRQAFPHARITLLTSFPINGKAAPMETILQNTGLYDDTLRYPTSLRNPAELKALRTQLQAGRYDCLIYLAKPKGGLLTSVRDYLFFRSSGIPRVIGVPFTAAKLRCQPLPGSGLYQSETERTLACLRELGAVDVRDSRWWDLRLTPGEIAQAETLLDRAGISGPFLAASVGTKIQAKDWEEDNWQALIRRLGQANPHLPLVLFGVQDERDRSERLASRWPGPAANFCGLTSPRVSAAVLRHASLMVCHDSGPMHLAAAMGIPCVAIFSARGKPGEWYPCGENHTVIYHRTPCWDCGLTTCIENKKACILSITVDEVFAAVQPQLARHSVPSRPRDAFSSP